MIHLRKKLGIETSDHLYPEICDFYNELFLYLNEQNYAFNLIKTKNNVDLEKANSVKKSLRKIISHIEEIHYSEWIKSKDKETLFRTAYGYKEKLEIYDRKMNFELKTTEDPLTKDEVVFIINFAKEVFKEHHFDSIHDVPLSCAKIALNSLITN
mgnify:CR=1 FL=1